MMRVHTDGGCRDNPGPGAWAFVIWDENGQTFNYSGFLPHCTNNQAEYRALEAACLTVIRLPDDHGRAKVEIFSDSQLIVEQINQRYRVKDEGLRPFYESALKAFRLLGERYETTLSWVKRDQNTEADALCNIVMDKRGIVCSRKRTSRDD